MVRRGQGLGHGAERRLTKVFQKRDFTILVDLGLGKSGVTYVDHGFILRIRAHQRELSLVTGPGWLQSRARIMLAFGRFRAVKGLSHRSPLEPHNQGRLI